MTVYMGIAPHLQGYSSLSLRGDEKWDNGSDIIYYGVVDSTTSDYRIYTSLSPFTVSTELDVNIGTVDGFVVVGRYIFVQRTDDGEIGLHVSENRKPFQRALIPTPSSHQQ